MSTVLRWISRVFFHAWHFVYSQIQLTVWFGNIVAGVVTFVALTLVWPKFRTVVTRAFGVTALHDKLDRQHRERLTQASQHHQAALLLAKSHHEAHMAALRTTPPKVPARPRPVKSPVAKKASPTPRKATK